jgi:hypothetical protein
MDLNIFPVKYKVMKDKNYWLSQGMKLCCINKSSLCAFTKNSSDTKAKAVFEILTLGRESSRQVQEYFLFPKLKFPLKGRHFQTVEEIQRAVTRELNNI